MQSEYSFEFKSRFISQFYKMSSEFRFKSDKPYNKEFRTSFNSSWPKYRRNYDQEDRRLKKSEPNRVLRIKCLNALHQVSTETLYYVFSTYGKVLRIVIFYTGESLNAMVEFDRIDGKFTKFIQINLQMTNTQSHFSCYHR